jgi:oligosaccharide repeat unit polymerase
MRTHSKKGIDLSSPFFIYVFIWSLLLYLYNLKIIDYYIGLNTSTLVLVIGSLITFALGWMIIRIIYKKRSVFQMENITNIQISRLRIWLNRFLKIWLIGMFLTVIIQKGFPLLWMITGVDKSYGDFGFDTIHGFLTSLYLFGILGYFFVYLKTKQKKYLIIILLLLLYPILVIHRSIMVIVVFEFLGIYLFIKRIQFKNILKVLLLFFALIYAFGALGDYRLNNKTDFLYDWISDDYKESFEKIPSGFLWSYIYFTAPLDNIVYNIDKIKPLYYPYHSTASLLPTIVRKNIYTEKKYEEKYSMKMSNPVINTFTYFANYISDFGIVFTLFIVFNLQLLILYTYVRAKNNNLGALLAYPVFFMALLLSTFNDYFSSLVVIFQIFLAFYVGRRISKTKTQIYA